MTIAAQIPFVLHAGDGVSVSFPFNFPTAEPDDIEVTLIVGIVRTPLVYGVDWWASVLTPFSTRSVVCNVAPPNGSQLELVRATDEDQEADYISNGGFPALVTEQGLDKLTMRLQELNRRLGLVESSGAGAGYTFANIGLGSIGVFAQVVGNEAQFKRLRAGVGITLTDDGSSVLFDAVVPFTLPVSIANGGTGQTTQQAAIDALTLVAPATTGHVLTKDGSGNATWAAAPGVVPPGGILSFLRSDGNWSATLGGPLRVEGSGVSSKLAMGNAGAAAGDREWDLQATAAGALALVGMDDARAVSYGLARFSHAGGTAVLAEIAYGGGRTMINGPTDDGTSALQVAGALSKFYGNLQLSGDSRKLIADFSNATLANRAVIQDSGGLNTNVWAAPGAASYGAAIGAISHPSPGDAGRAIEIIVGPSGAARLQTYAINGGTAAAIDVMPGLFTKIKFPAQANGYEVVTAGGFEVEDWGSLGATPSIDLGYRQWHKGVMSDNATFTFTAPPYPCIVHLVLTQDGTGSRTMTLPASVKWTAATTAAQKLLSTGAGDRDLLVLRWDGTDYLAQLFKDY